MKSPGIEAVQAASKAKNNRDPWLAVIFYGTH